MKSGALRPEASADFRPKNISAEFFFWLKQFSIEIVVGRKHVWRNKKSVETSFGQKKFSAEKFAVRIAEGGTNVGVQGGGSSPGPFVRKMFSIAIFSRTYHFRAASSH